MAFDVKRVMDDDRPSNRKISLCPYCLESGFREILGPKILLKNEPRPPDYDQFLQCYACGNTFGKFETKMESELSSVVEVTKNPSMKVNL